jgi:hypothetical protein
MSILLKDLLKRLPDDTEERVYLAYRRINNEVREAVRRETGLVLHRQNVDSRERKVSVSVVQGIPTVLQNMSFDNDLILTISPFRRELEMIRNGIKGVEPLIKKLSQSVEGKALISGDDVHINQTNALVIRLLKLLDVERSVEKILEINEDVLGTYIYKIPPRSAHYDSSTCNSARIELYWGVIGLIAGMLAVEIEPLTAVVLIHEIAHAYTHLGADIDGERWGSINFSNSKRALKEGLAQYYTYLISKRIDNKIMGTYKAYELLLKEQPRDYHSHEGIIDEYKPEEIRLALIKVRRSSCESTMEYFFDLLAEARAQLRNLNSF